MTLVPLRRNVLTDARGARAGEATLARRYKLRLSDGTILAVDFEGLTVWLMDKKAMVQTAGSREWRPLKEVIAEVRVAAKYAEREKRRAGEQEKKRGGREDLPLVPPPDKAGGRPSPEAPVVEEVSAEDARIGEPQGIQSLADDPVGPAAGPDEPIGVADEPVGVADEPIGVADAPEHADDGGFVGAFIDEEPDTRPPEPAPVVPEPPPPTPLSRGPAVPDTSAAADLAPEPSIATDAGDDVSSGPDVGSLQPSDDDVSRLIDSLDSARVDEGLLGSSPDVAALPDDAAPEAPSVPEAPSTPEAPPIPEAPTFPEAPETPEAPSVPQTPEAPATPEAPGLPDAPLVPGAPVSAQDPPPVVPAEEGAIGAPPGVTSLADDPAPSPAEKPTSAGAPPATPEPPARVRVVVRDPVARPAPPPGPGESPPPPVESPPAPVESPPAPQVPADQVTGRTGSSIPRGYAYVDRSPVIPTKHPETDRPVSDSASDEASAPGSPGGFVAMLLAAVGAVGALFSRLLEPITRLERGEPLVDDDAPPVLGPSVEKLKSTATGWAGGVRERAASGAEPAMSRVVSALQSATSTLSARVGGLVDRFRGVWPAGDDQTTSDSEPEPASPPTLEREDEASSISPVALRVEPRAASIEPDAASVSEPAPEPPEPAIPADAPEPPTPSPPPLELPSRSPARSESPAPEPAPRLTAPPLEEPPKPPRHAPPVPPRSPAADSPVPPPGTDDLEVLPLAEPIAPREPVDVYEEEGEGIGDFLRSAWAWAKLLMIVGLVGAVAAFATLNWRTWFPKAAEIGEATFTEVDRVARSAERAEELRKAVEEASPQLPHLAPRTIRLVMSSSTTALPEPSEVFRIAGEAADRGLGTLSVEEARELEALRGELSDGLGPLEQEQLEGYARTRARRIVFAEEHTHALALVARGTRTLPPERRERLQEILAKAIAAGLGPPGPRGGGPLEDEPPPEPR